MKRNVCKLSKSQDSYAIEYFQTEPNDPFIDESKTLLIRFLISGNFYEQNIKEWRKNKIGNNEC